MVDQLDDADFKRKKLDALLPESALKPELIFALVGPIGTNLESVVSALGAALFTVGYRLRPSIKLSEVIAKYVKMNPAIVKKYNLDLARVEEAKYDVRTSGLMEAGDRIREWYDHGGAVAALSILDVQAERGGPSQPPAPATAFLLNSIKHHGEVGVLRKIYGESLVVISVFQPEETRRRNLGRKIEKSWGTQIGTEAAAETLMKRDEADASRKDFGQNVREAFALADFFLDGRRNVNAQIDRLIRLQFGHPFISPTPDEYAMFLAAATARRSLDLSRQVGAVIVDHRGEVVAAGCNEVPRPGGGIYLEGDNPDKRDWEWGADPNAIMGREVIQEIFECLKGAEGWLVPEKSQKEAVDLWRESQNAKVFGRARVRSLIEFGRVVHAEMHALAHASRSGRSTCGTSLYCTTFPCHVCARHLLAAGLDEVVYIEPYEKSLARELYPEAIEVGQQRVEGRLIFRPFMGIAPVRFLDYFGAASRKDAAGYRMDWNPADASPRGVSPNTHVVLEQHLCSRLLDDAQEEHDDDDRQENPDEERAS